MIYQKIKLVTQLIIAVVLACPMFVSGQQEKIESANKILEQLDNARLWSEWISVNEALQDVGPDAVSLLRQYSIDTTKDSRKRFMALKATFKYIPKSQGYLELLHAYTNDKDPVFRTECAREMGKIKDDSFKPSLRKVIDTVSENGMVQVASAEALAVMKDPYGKERALHSVLNGEPWSDFGISALEQINDVNMVSEIEKKSLNESNQKIKGIYVMAILRLRLRRADEKQKMALLRQGLEEKESLNVRQYSAQALGELGTTEAAEILTDSAKKNTSPGKDQALDGLKIGIVNKKWSAEQVTKWMK